MKILIIAPHQDDETLGCGGLIYKKVKEGCEIRVLFLTDGRYGGDIGVRRREAIEALEVLGVKESKIDFMNWEDGDLSYLLSSKSKYKKDSDNYMECLKAYIENYKPENIYVTYKHDRLPDHEAAYYIVKSLGIKNTKIIQYAVWFFYGRTWPLRYLYYVMKGDRFYREDIKTERKIKQRAIDCYKSQKESILPKRFIKMFNKSYEVYIEDK